MHNKGKISFFAIIIVICLVLLAGAAYLILEQRKYKVYENTKYNYSFKFLNEEWSVHARDFIGEDMVENPHGTYVAVVKKSGTAEDVAFWINEIKPRTFTAQGITEMSGHFESNELPLTSIDGKEAFFDTNDRWDAYYLQIDDGRVLMIVLEKQHYDVAKKVFKSLEI